MCVQRVCASIADYVYVQVLPICLSASIADYVYMLILPMSVVGSSLSSPVVVVAVRVSLNHAPKTTRTRPG